VPGAVIGTARRWRLREPSPGRTRVELRLTYGVAGAGFFGWVAERAAGPIVRGHLTRSLAQLKRQVEHDELRRAAARTAPPAPRGSA
jgi:hypothetical protein